jgi:hypothetical protein
MADSNHSLCRHDNADSSSGNLRLIHRLTYSESVKFYHQLKHVLMQVPFHEPVSIYIPGAPGPLRVSCSGRQALPACILHIPSSCSFTAAAISYANLFVTQANRHRSLCTRPTANRALHCSLGLYVNIGLLGTGFTSV